MLDDETRLQFAALGADPSALPQPETEKEDFEVWAPNWPALSLFLAAATQWRTAATMAGVIWLGLDYTAVDVIARRLGVEADWLDLQEMEGAALPVLNEART